MVSDTFIGFVGLESTLQIFVQTTTTAGVPISADSTISWRIYGPAGGSPLLTGTFGSTPINAQTGFYNTPSINIFAANGFAAGNTYFVRIAYAVSAGTNQVQVQRFVVT